MSDVGNDYLRWRKKLLAILFVEGTWGYVLHVDIKLINVDLFNRMLIPNPHLLLFYMM